MSWLLSSRSFTADRDQVQTVRGTDDRRLFAITHALTGSSQWRLAGERMSRQYRGCAASCGYIDAAPRSDDHTLCCPDGPGSERLDTRPVLPRPGEVGA